MRDYLTTEFGCSGEFSEVRTMLKGRAQAVTLLAAEPRLKAFCLRLTDTSLPGDAWLESLGSLLTAQPPTKWRDADEDTFQRDLNALVQRFRDLETIAFKQPRSIEHCEAYKLALTRHDGHESQEVVYFDRARAREVDALARKIQELIRSDRSVALPALSKAIWSALEEK